MPLVARSKHLHPDQPAPAESLTMKPEPIETALPDAAATDVDARLEHLAAVISGQRDAGGETPTLLNLRELYDSRDPISTRFVRNLLQCAVCTASWRCDHCEYRQASSPRPAG